MQTRGLMTEQRKRSVLITGGCGFIGSHLSERLCDDGMQVTVLDDLSTGEWKNVSHLEERDGFRAIIGNAGDWELVEREVARHDLVYHLASAVGVKLIMDEPIHTVESIFHPTDIVLKACARYRTPVLVTSTSEVYGKSTTIPFQEDADVVMGATSKRRWAYACAKALDEFLALAHHHQTRLPVFVVRLFNTVGPKQSSQYGMVIPRFVQQALDGEPITVYGDGEQRRCFCHVDDVVEALRALPSCPEAAGTVVNVGSQEETTILGLAERIKALTDSSSEIRLVPYEVAYGEGFDDMRRRVPDIDRVASLIGWQPTKSLDEILQSVIDERSA